MFFRSKSVLEELGVVYDTDGNAYKLYSTNKKLNKSMIDMYQKFNLELRSQVILKKDISYITTLMRFVLNLKTYTILLTFSLDKP